MKSHVNFCFVAFVIAYRLVTVDARPWNLPDYDLCSSHRLDGIKAEASGVTYNPITNSIWVITRRPPVIGEYSMSGKMIRTISTEDAKLSDPEGITWMYDYTYAVSQERAEGSSERSSVSIVEAAPWHDEVKLVKRIIVRDIRQRNNAGLESITWDAERKRLLAGQEMKPMQVWEIDPRDGDSRKAFREFERDSRFKDLGGMYKRKGDDGLYVLSEPTKTVLHIDERGRRKDGQYKVVRGRLPEGLTFTEDGEIMVIVGEPYEMFIYSSTGNCDYEPGLSTRGTGSVASFSSEEGDSSDDRSVRVDSLSDSSENIDQLQENSDFVPASSDEDEKQPVAGASNLASARGAERPSDPWFLKPELGFCSVDNSCNHSHTNPWCANSTSNCLGCRATWCPKFGIDEDPITHLDEDAKDLLMIEELEDGYMALMNVLLDGIPKSDDPSGLKLRKAVSTAVFGDPDAHVVLFTESTPDSARRRLIENEIAVSSIKIKILAETRYHAKYLQKRLEGSIMTGALSRALSKEGLNSVGRIQMWNQSVTTSGMSPQSYPTHSRSWSPEDNMEVIAYIGQNMVTQVTLAATLIAVLAVGAAVCGLMMLRWKRKRSLEVVPTGCEMGFFKASSSLCIPADEEIASKTVPKLGGSMQRCQSNDSSTSSEIRTCCTVDELALQDWANTSCKLMVDIPGTSNAE